jgi:thiamine biosynthesis lipoprotein
MACRFEVTLEGEDAPHVAAAREALDEVDRIEAALTVFRDTSELVRLNRLAGREPVVVDRELLDLLGLCREIHDSTEGAFDVTTTPLSRCWGFLARAGRLPEADEIEQARSVIGMTGVLLDPAESTVRFRRSGMELNLGSIGKGYALRRMAALLKARRVERALLSAAGSSVLAWGGRGRGFAIDLCSRLVARQRLARVLLREGALGTSGAGEQFVVVDGVRYGHVLDPRSGWPARGVLSATVITSDAPMADALSTAFLVGGAELASRYCAAHDDVLALVTLDDGSERQQVLGRYAGATLEDMSETAEGRPVSLPLRGEG